MKKPNDKTTSSLNSINPNLILLNNGNEHSIKINNDKKNIDDSQSLNIDQESEIEKNTIEKNIIEKNTADPTIFGDWQINCKTIDF